MKLYFKSIMMLVTFTGGLWAQKPAITCRPLNATDQLCGAHWKKPVTGTLLVVHGSHEVPVPIENSASVGWPAPLGTKVKFKKFTAIPYVPAVLVSVECALGQKSGMDECILKFDRAAHGNLILFMGPGEQGLEFPVHGDNMMVQVPHLPERVSFVNEATGKGNWKPPVRKTD